jgi:single-stranded DNA-binding protein
MKHINQVHIAGSVYKVDSQTTPRGLIVAYVVRVETPRNNRIYSSFLRCVAHNNQNVKKDDLVSIKGIIHIRQYQQNGYNKFITEILIDELHIIQNNNTNDSPLHVAPKPYNNYILNDTNKNISINLLNKNIHNDDKHIDNTTNDDKHIDNTTNDDKHRVWALKQGVDWDEIPF